MSKCYKCDRCGSILTDTELASSKIKTLGGKEVLVKIVRLGGYNDIDVCDECYKSFRNWWFNEDGHFLPFNKIQSEAPVEDTILGRTEDISDPHPEEVRS